MMPVRFSEDGMADETKRRAPTWDDVREAYAEGLYTPPPDDGACDDFDLMWKLAIGAPWHPDSPANRIAGFEWRTDAPEAGALIQRRGALGCMVLDRSHAEAIMRAAERQPELCAWRYVDPPATTTSEDNS